jgi:L-xylulokinase
MMTTNGRPPMAEHGPHSAPHESGSRFLLGIDVGQTAVKAVLHDERLLPVAVARRASPVDRPVARHAERSQDALWAAVADAVSEVMATSGVDPTLVAAVGITGHGDGLHLVTAAGAPVGPAITAMDSRAHVEAAELAADPERVQQADAMLFCKDVVRLRLTGEISTDYSDACASFLDVGTATWSAEVLDAYGLPAELLRLLPPINPSGTIVGSVLPEAAAVTGLVAGTPVVSGLHDVQASSIGMGALVPGRLALVAGSFSTNGVTTTQPDVDPRWQSRLSITPDLRIAMSTSATASPSFDWTLRLLGVTDATGRDALIAEAAALPPEEQVPLVLPFQSDSPLGAEASATLAGVRDWHTRAHVLRGALEGIVLMHRWHTRALGERFRWDEPIVLGGGLARSPLYVQLVANALRAPVTVVDSEEAGALGAAIVAGVATGLLPSVEQAQHDVVRHAPAVLPTDASAAYWAGVGHAFDELVEALGPWWRRRAEESSPDGPASERDDRAGVER